MEYLLLTRVVSREWRVVGFGLGKGRVELTDRLGKVRFAHSLTHSLTHVWSGRSVRVKSVSQSVASAQPRAPDLACLVASRVWSCSIGLVLHCSRRCIGPTHSPLSKRVSSHAADTDVSIVSRLLDALCLDTNFA